MTHDNVNTERENAGSLDVAVQTIDITALDAAGTENYNPRDEVGLSGADRFGVSVRGIADPTVQVTWDHVAEELNVVNVADATDVADNTAVGQVVLEVTGV